MIRRLWERLTGREAAALREQRDRYAFTARLAQQATVKAERERDELRKDLAREYDAVTLFHGEAYHAHANAEGAADERDTAVALLRAIVAARGPDRDAVLAGAAGWLQGRTEPRGEAIYTEGEGSRGGLGWAPGDHEDTLESERN